MRIGIGVDAEDMNVVVRSIAQRFNNVIDQYAPDAGHTDLQGRLQQRNSRTTDKTLTSSVRAGFVEDERQDLFVADGLAAVGQLLEPAIEILERIVAEIVAMLAQFQMQCVAAGMPAHDELRLFTADVG